MRVVPEGNMTMTTYGVREELDEGTNTYRTNFSSFGEIVHVEMVVWDAVLITAENLTLDGPLAEIQ